MSSCSSPRRQQQKAAGAMLGLLGLLLLPGGADASFHVPGLAPKSYKLRENVRCGVGA
jgi:hypothetical protein